MRHVRLLLMGFGNVGRALVSLLARKQALLEREYGITFQVNGVMTGRHGAAFDPLGLDLKTLIRLGQSGGDLSELSAQPVPASRLAFIRQCKADIFFENTPVSYHDGQPAIGYLWTALENGMHAITANKGPVVNGLRELEALAKRQNRRFLYESAVMDGAPIFSLFRGSLPAIEVQGFTGILNSTTNLILQLMEQGKSFAEAVEVCRVAGLTETDPSGDIDAWDAAVKVCALSNVVMGADLRPRDIQREGIRGITPEDILSALSEGRRWKLVCRAVKDGAQVRGSVGLEKVAPDSRLYSINGSSSYVEFQSDVLPGLGIVETDPGPETTAYGLLADMISVMRGG